jgi:glutaredoxin-like YruB-family protein
MEVVVYSTPTCPYCKMAKSLLDENGITYRDVDVSQDAAGRDELIKKSGQMGVPVVDVDGEIIIGFDREALDNIARKDD